MHNELCYPGQGFNQHEDHQYQHTAAKGESRKIHTFSQNFPVKKDTLVATLAGSVLVLDSVDALKRVSTHIPLLYYLLPTTVGIEIPVHIFGPM